MSIIKIRTEWVLGEDIKPGELFSTAGPEYWDSFGEESLGSIGERVYIRTHAPIPECDIGTGTYRITIVTVEKCHVCCPEPPYRCPCGEFCECGHRPLDELDGDTNG